ncbi:MAG: histidine phosphatase family protein [Myxococcales bacterium]|nr:histidine phosphatase family protein [Myxococcales bacterium]
MVTVHLLRHGQTAWNVERRFLGRTDVELDPVGEAQVTAMADVFPKVSGVWSSPLKRALSTAAAIGTPRVDAGLVEMDMGVLEGLDGPSALEQHRDVLARFRSDPTVVLIPAGETMVQTADRMARAWARIIASGSSNGALNEPIAIVSHQMALAALLCRLTRSPLAAYQTFTQRNTAWTTVRIDDPAEPLRVTVLARDQGPHLVGGG